MASIRSVARGQKHTRRSNMKTPEEKQKKLEEAIELGFIIRTIDPDNKVRYELTQKGQMQWMLESRK